MSEIKLPVFIFLFLLCFSVYAERPCFSDQNCPEYYSCSLGSCVLDDAVFTEKEYISVYQEITAVREKYMGYSITDSVFDVVLGAFSFLEKSGSGDSPSMIKRINFKFEKSGNIQIENLKLFIDTNKNGKFDSSDIPVMNEPDDSYGTNSRFIEYDGRAELLNISGEINFLVVADYNVDRSNNTWPAYVQIKSIESILFSSNVTAEIHPMVFDKVALPPWGDIVFFDMDNASLIGTSLGATLTGIRLTSLKDTRLKKITLIAEKSMEPSVIYLGFGDGFTDDNGVFFLTLEDSETGQKIYSIESSEYKKTFDVDFQLKADIPVEIKIESEGEVCSYEYRITFPYDALSFSDDSSFIYRTSSEINGDISYDSDICGDPGFGCSVTVF